MTAMTLNSHFGDIGISPVFFGTMNRNSNQAHFVVTFLMRNVGARSQEAKPKSFWY